MPLARRKADRLRQVARWLTAKFPCPYPVSLHLSRFPEGPGSLDYGATTRKGRRFHIYLNTRYPRHLLIMILLHEWAHARSWRHETMEKRKLTHHDAEWGLAFAEIYCAFAEDDGDDESEEY